MSISARFEADFTSFQSAVRGAEVSLKSFETGAGRVGTALDRMVDSFSGRKVVQDANLMVEAVERVGGTSKLTAAELERLGVKASEAVAKLRALGLDVPAGLQRIADGSRLTGAQLDAMGNKGVVSASAIAEHTGRATQAQQAMIATARNLAATLGITFSVGAVVQFGRQLFELADQLVKTSDRTGLTIEQVQRLSFIADQSGNSIDQLTQAVGKMQVNMNDPKAQASFRELNINLNALRSAGPYEALRLLAAGFGSLTNPVQQAEHAVAIFGRGGLEILPTLKAEWDKLANGVSVASDKQVRALEAAGDALERAKTQVTNLGVGTLGTVALMVEKFGAWQVAAATLVPGLSALAGISFNDMAEDVTKAAKAMGDVNLALQVNPLVEYRKHLAGLRTESNDLTGVQMVLIRQGHELGESNAEIAAGLGNVSERAVAAYLKMVEGAKKATEETNKLRAAEKKLYEDIRAFSVSQLRDMTNEVNAELRKQMDAMGAAAAQLVVYSGQAQTAYQGLFDPAPITGFEAELERLDKWLAAELAKISGLAAAAGGAWQGQAEEAADAVRRAYERMFADALNGANQFSDGAEQAFKKAEESAKGASNAVQGMSVSLRGMTSEAEAAWNALSRAEQVLQRMGGRDALDAAGRAATQWTGNVGINTANYNREADNALLRSSGTTSGKSIIINVHGGATQADGKAAADGFLSTIRSKGMQL